MVRLTAEKKQELAAALGIDFSKIDWAKALQILQLVLSLFAQPGPAVMKNSGCPDEDLTHCCELTQAGQHALQAAVMCFQHAADCCEPV